MYPAPLIVFDADAFVDRPEAPPKSNAAVTESAFADVAVLFNDTRTTNVVPATYVPLPVRYAGAPVIVSNACALMVITRLLVSGPNARPEISSVPVTFVVIVTEGWLAAPAPIVTRKSMTTTPLTVFDADAFAKMLLAPPNDKGAVTVSAFADAAGLDNETRTTNVVPATYVPLPVIQVKLVISRNACALIVAFKALAKGPNVSPDNSSVPLTVAVIVTVGWLGAPAAIVIRKSINPVPLTVMDAEAFAEMPDAPPKLIDAETDNAFAEVTGFDNAMRITKSCPATYVPLPLSRVKLVITRLACALIATNSLVTAAPLMERPEYCPVPVHVALIFTDGWLIAFELTVIKKSI